MDEFDKLYRKDQYFISRWAKHYTNEEFYRLNKRVIIDLEKLISRAKKLTPKQKFICAIIYHHGFKMAYSKKAMRYIKEAQSEGYNRQKWLIASIEDRLLQIQGKPQKYGTQVVEIKKGKMKQYRLDGSVSDEERVKLGLPKLGALKKYLES